MRFTASLLLASTTLAAPILTERLQLIPTLPNLGIVAIRDAIHARITQTFGVEGPRAAYYGDLVNKYIPFGQTMKAVITPEAVNQIDILADRLCIAGAGQGSLCNELLAYAYAWGVAQQNGWTYGFVAESLGANNMQQIADATGTLCLQPADDGTAREQGLCQKIAYDIDQNANALIQDNTDAEDLGNSNSLDYFGLSAILPKPAPLGV